MPQPWCRPRARYPSNVPDTHGSSSLIHRFGGEGGGGIWGTGPDPPWRVCHMLAPWEVMSCRVMCDGGLRPVAAGASDPCLPHQRESPFRRSFIFITFPTPRLLFSFAHLEVLPHSGNTLPVQSPKGYLGSSSPPLARAALTSFAPVVHAPRLHFLTMRLVAAPDRVLSSNIVTRR